MSASAWIALFTLSLFYVLSFIDRQILSMMVDPIKRDLGANDVEMSLLMGFAFAAFYTLCGLLMGGVVDRYPRRLIVYFGVTAWSLATVYCGMADSYAGLFIGRMAVGIGEATLTPAAFSILADMFPRRRLSLAIALFILGSAVGTALTLAGGGLVVESLSRTDVVTWPLIGVVQPWQATFLMLGAVGVVLAGSIFLVPEPARLGTSAAEVDETPSWGQAFAWIIRQRRLWLAVSMTYVPLGLISTVTAVWNPTYMARNFGWTPAEFGIGLALAYAVPVALGSALNGIVVDRLYARGMVDVHFRYFMIISIVSIAFGIAAYLVDDPIAFLMLLAVPAFLLMGSGGFAAAGLQMVTPNRLRGRVAGFYMVMVTLPAFAVGPSMVALLAQQLFRSEEALGMAIALTMAGLLPLIIVGSTIGMRVMRKLVPQVGADRI